MTWVTVQEVRIADDGSIIAVNLHHRSDLKTIGAYTHRVKDPTVRNEKGKLVPCPVCVKEGRTT